MSILQGNFGISGNYEAVHREFDQLVHYWRNNDDCLQDVSYWNRAFPIESLMRSGYPVCPWYQSVRFGTNVRSQPAILKSNFGRKGNFELLVWEGDGLRHYWRNNDTAGLPWLTGILFGSGVCSAPAMVQSNFGYRGNFEVVVREGNQLRHYWRDNDSQNLTWHGGSLIGDNVSSSPAMIVSSYGNRGNFEVVVREGDNLRHYWRDNDSASLQWHKGALFGSGATGDPSMIELKIDQTRRDFFVVVEGSGNLQFYRRNGTTGQWESSGNLTSAITDNPSLLRSSFDQLQEFEVFTKRGNEHVHMIRVFVPYPGTYNWSSEILTHVSPPTGTQPNQEQIERFRRIQFLNLRTWNITDISSSYNCIAWSLGLNSGWLWPDYSSFGCDWQYIPFSSQISLFDNFYAAFGFTQCDNGAREPGKRKIALYANGNVISHASRQYDTGDWHTSKCGMFERIIHDKFQMQGEFSHSYVDTSTPLNETITYQSYGRIIRYYIKEDPGTNIDIA